MQVEISVVLNVMRSKLFRGHRRRPLCSLDEISEWCVHETALIESHEIQRGLAVASAPNRVIHQGSR